MARRLVRQQPTKPPEAPKEELPELPEKGRRTQPDSPLPLDEAYVVKLAGAYKGTKEAIKSFTSRAENIKSELLRFVIEHGEPDENGSLWLEGEGYKLKRERRVQRWLNAEAVEAWAREKGVWDDITDVIPEHRELSEDKLVKLAWEKGSEDPEMVQLIAAFYEEKETWAFVQPS